MPSSAPAVPAGAAGVGGLGHVASLVGGHLHIGIDRRVGRLDGRQIGVGQLDAGKGALLHFVTGFGDGQTDQVGHADNFFSKNRE
jgi:hypothetical protein